MDSVFGIGVLIVLALAACVFLRWQIMNRARLAEEARNVEVPEDPKKAAIREKFEEQARNLAAWEAWDAEIERRKAELEQAPPLDQFKVQQDPVSGLWRVYRRKIRLPWDYERQSLRHYEGPRAGIPTVRWCWEIVESQFPSRAAAVSFAQGAGNPDPETYHFDADGREVQVEAPPPEADEDDEP